MGDRRRMLFRLLAAALPFGLGLLAVVGILAYRGWQDRPLDLEKVYRFAHPDLRRHLGEAQVASARPGLIEKLEELILTRGPVYVQEPGHESTGHRYIYDPLLGWRNIPGWTGNTFGHAIHINSQGLRDQDYVHEYERLPGMRRILVLGDSYTWGYGVAGDEIFTEVMERQYKRQGQPVDVINTGVSGWGTDQEYLYLLSDGFRYSSDIVVVAFFILNDPENNAHSMQYGLHKPLFTDLELNLQNVPVPRPMETVPAMTGKAEPLELTKAVFSAMARFCAGRQCRLVVMKFGSFLTPGEERDQADRAFVQDVASMGELLYLDLDAAFAARDLTKEQLIKGNTDGHWNAFGHRVTAEVLEEFLQEQGLVPLPGAP